MFNVKYIEQYIHHFGLDHLEVFWSFKDTSLFEKLDFDNSHEWTLDEYTIEKHKVPKYAYKITFRKDTHTLFAYYVWLPKSKKQPVATRDYIIAYGTAFRVLEYEEILYFFEYYLELSHCRRFDICIDLKWIEINDLLEWYFHEYMTGREYKKSWKIRTRYYWELKNSQNKRQIIRVYNKINDIKEKNKFALYGDYFDLGDVTRIELEVRQELAKTKHYREVFNDNTLLQIFKNYLKKHTNIFEILPWENETLYRNNKKYRYANGKRIELTPEDYQWLFYATERERMLEWHLKAIYNLWFCPVRIAIWLWYIKPKTERILWGDLINHLLHMEKKVKQDFFLKKIKQKDFQHLLDNSPEYEE